MDILDGNESYQSNRLDSRAEECQRVSIESDPAMDTCPIEPPGTQRIRLDFTPIEEVDNDYVQYKCCQFWDFIHSIPEIQHLMVMPEKDNVTPAPSAADFSESSIIDVEEDTIEMEQKQRTAMSMLNIAVDNGYISPILDTKIPRSQCTLGSREYKDTEKLQQQMEDNGPCYGCEYHMCGSMTSLGPCPYKDEKLPSLKKLVRDMREWDAAHPKPMEPPSHPASLQHCVLQSSILYTSYSNSEKS